jgi:hypothetical protein
VTLERIVIFLPPYDKRDPDPTKNLGIGTMWCHMILKGPDGAVQFVWSTGIYNDSAKEHLLKFCDTPRDVMEHIKPEGYDRGFHSPKPLYEGQSRMDNCPYTDVGYCYYDGSGLAAEPLMELLMAEGSEPVWKELERYYEEVFGEAEQ